MPTKNEKINNRERKKAVRGNFPAKKKKILMVNIVANT